MMACFDVSGKSAEMVEMDSMPSALSSSARRTSIRIDVSDRPVVVQLC